MRSFPLKIVTPDGLVYDGQAEELIVRTTTGDMGFLAGHVNAVAPLGEGRATVIIDGQRRCANCTDGLVSVLDGTVTLIPASFEWIAEIENN